MTLREPDPGCVSCRGKGTNYNATAGEEGPCRCTTDPHYEPTREPAATRPPAGFGMPGRTDG
jgi:hypothetical protein